MLTFEANLFSNEKVLTDEKECIPVGCPPPALYHARGGSLSGVGVSVLGVSV